MDTRTACFFFFNDTATTEIYTLSLHDALPICGDHPPPHGVGIGFEVVDGILEFVREGADVGHLGHPPHEQERRSEEHTSELQSQSNLVCRLLLEKKN